MPKHYTEQRNSATIALLEQWEREDTTDDPLAIAQAERDLAEFKTALNTNRPPDSPIFPKQCTTSLQRCLFSRPIA